MAGEENCYRLRLDLLETLGLIRAASTLYIHLMSDADLRRNRNVPRPD